MIVSILQLMGFRVGKPLHSRADEIAHGNPSKADIERIGSQAPGRAASTKQASTGASHGQKKPARRQEVKAQPAKAQMASKATEAVVKTKPAAKKTSVKPVAKKAVPTKAPVKVSPKAPKPQPTPEVKIKVAPVKADKAAVKVKVEKRVKTTTMKAAQSEMVISKPKVTHSAASGTVAKAAMPVKPAVAPATPVGTTSVPARAGRPSSRLAQLTVPSMAQSVASTAAKASFIQTTSLPLIVPPLASAVKKDPKLVNNWKLKPIEQLTDADLIAMPDDEYMNDTQMAYFRRKLTVLKQDILSNAGETTEHLREDTSVVPDPADRATIEEEHALELRTRDRERKLLKKIEQSIQRIDAGDYGYCDETGESIGVGRLLARPTANLSLEAQQRRELKQKMFGD